MASAPASETATGCATATACKRSSEQAQLAITVEVLNVLSGEGPLCVNIENGFRECAPEELGVGHSLKVAIAERLGVDESRILVFVGSEEISDFGAVDLGDLSCQPLGYLTIGEIEHADSDSDDLELPPSRMSAFERQEWENDRARESESIIRIQLLLGRSMSAGMQLCKKDERWHGDPVMATPTATASCATRTATGTGTATVT